MPRNTRQVRYPLSMNWLPQKPWILGFFLVLLYGRVCIRLVADWYNLPDFSHGFLVPFFAGYILWERRRVLAELEYSPRWSGVAVVVFAVLLLFAGVYGAEIFLARISLLVMLAGIALALRGWSYLKHISFALFVLLLGIPIPAVIFNQVTFPLQILASKAASDLLPVLGVPVLREGNVIQLASLKLEVAEACSGIRSLLSLFTVAVLFGYFMEKSIRNRVLLAIASLPIAVVANVVRIVGTGLCVQYWNPDKAVGFFHEFSGWLMFLVSLACLYLVHLMLQLLPSRKDAMA